MVKKAKKQPNKGKVIYSGKHMLSMGDDGRILLDEAKPLAVLINEQFERNPKTNEIRVMLGNAPLFDFERGATDGTDASVWGDFVGDFDTRAVHNLTLLIDFPDSGELVIRHV